MPKTRPSNVTVEAVSPVVDAGRFPAKATVGEPVLVQADVFTSGHDVVDAALRWRFVSSPRARPQWSEVPMSTEGNDRFTATFVPDRLGQWQYEVVGWVDHAESWRQGIVKKIDAGVDIAVDILGGIRIVEHLVERASSAGAVDDAASLRDLAADLAAGETGSLDDDTWTEIFWRHVDREPLATLPRALSIDVDPELARFSAWYEFFPRSAVAPATGHQTLKSAVDRLDHIAEMGFDVVYLPPIHPIGHTNRKGRNNSVVAVEGDVGSPWAIGSADGGHTAVEPALGTIDDLRNLVRECQDRGLQLSLDIAFNCTPDHPWVTAHPEWFGRRADGSIQFAENPPKRYEDIYPLDFESSDWQGLWSALADVFRFWIEQGITVFRVDNPHTKALPFWEWALRTLRSEHPETIFLAEAFTRPRVMERLAKIGFNQSYTYFAWRQSAWELREYFTDLSTRTVDYFRPNAWPNTPDILTEQLQDGGRPAFVNRAVLAATLSPSWGVYGPAFELQEAVAVRPGSEEYLDSEKYQLREWDLDAEQSLAPLLTRLNQIRRDQPALQHLRTTWFHLVDNPNLLCFSRTDPNGVGHPVLVVVNADHGNRQAGFVDIDLARLDLPYGVEYDVVDLLGGGTYRWVGNRNYVDLSPWGANAHIFSVRPAA
ncbi:MAG: alpha-1,4-glucan--maltose-1-phosphate maltosyltransferase [Ilumatobacteraceae bacterium]